MNKFLYIIFLLSISLTCFAETVKDDFAEKLIYNNNQEQPYINYNFESTEKIPINIKIIDPIKSEQKIYEGQTLKFKVAKNVLYKNNILIKRGTPVTAKISAIISPGMNGIPASIIISNFKIKEITKGQLSETYEIFGQDRSWLVFPLKWALTPLPPTGSLTNFIMGGHAKINYKKQLTIYYYPEW